MITFTAEILEQPQEGGTTRCNVWFQKNKIQIGVFFCVLSSTKKMPSGKRERESDLEEKWAVAKLIDLGNCGDWWECRYMFIFQLLEIISRSLGWFETPKRDDYNLQIFFCGLENQRVRFRGECNRVSRIEWILQEIKCLQYETVREKRTTTGKRRGFPSDLFESSKMLQVRMRTK